MSVIAGKIYDFIVEKVWGYMLAWLKLPSTLKKLEEKTNAKPLSKNAHFCPNCDTRMKLSSVFATGNWFKCPACNATQVYKTVN